MKILEWIIEKSPFIGKRRVADLIKLAVMISFFVHRDFFKEVASDTISDLEKLRENTWDQDLISKIEDKIRMFAP